MITIHELLEDPVYKAYFCKVPNGRLLNPHHRPWRVFIQKKDGKWGKKDFAKYSDAFKFLKKWLPHCHDAAIMSKARRYDPPTRFVALKKHGKPLYVMGSDGVKRRKTKMVVWQPKLFAGDEHHDWCPYCRRPTIRAWFSKHHNFPSGIYNTSELRCVICGAPEGFVRGRR